MDYQDEIRQHYNARPNMNENDRKRTKNINIREANNYVKMCLLTKYINPRDRVLDIGVGKGGDFGKYKNCRISELYGLDIANRSILDAVDRARGANYLFKIVLKTADAYGKPFNLRRCFDVVSIQFSLHYAFPSEEVLQISLENINRHLTTNGLLLLTILDKEEILRRKRLQTLSNAYYSIKLRDPESESIYGNAYYYTLVDSVDSCIEYMIDTDELCRRLGKMGFELVEKTGFDAFQNTSNGKLHGKRKINLLNLEEKEVFDLHIVVVFRKVR
ncbi:mRNA (guanine-N7-)-methyltransferase [Pancytospora epiphaga]|nr:mRNA (guanine-N7-)-methyltransferase [Pancytospora epiphaga]